MNDELRKQCKELKVFQGVAYTEIAGFLEVKRNSFYNWLNGYYNFGEDRQKQLQAIIETIKEI